MAGYIVQQRMPHSRGTAGEWRGEDVSPTLRAADRLAAYVRGLPMVEVRIVREDGTVVEDDDRRIG